MSADRDPPLAPFPSAGGPADANAEECPCPQCEPLRYDSRRVRVPMVSDRGGVAPDPDPEVPMTKLVYLCHPFQNDPAGNIERVRRICERLKDTCVPLAPHLLLPAYIDEPTERDVALRHCLRLVAACDEVRVYGEPTEGMRREIEEARRLGIPVVVVDDAVRRLPMGGGAHGLRERAGRPVPL